MKIREYLTSQIPSCWSSGFNGHPDLPIDAPPPPTHDRLQKVNGLNPVLQCPHCNKIWNRDVNACRYETYF